MRNMKDFHNEIKGHNQGRMFIVSVTKRRGIGPIRTEIIRKTLFIFQIVRFNGICIWQNYFCILSHFGDFGAKT